MAGEESYNSENLEESEFSLSKSNMEFGLASMKIDMDDICECLARLAIPDKIPKCPLTRFTNPSSDYLTLKTKTLLRGQCM